MRSAFTRFINHFLPVRIRFRDNLLVTLLRFGQFLPNFVRVDLALFDLALTLFQQGKDRFVSESCQKERNTAESKDLHKKKLPIPAEVVSRFAQDVGYASAAGGKYRYYHKIKLAHAF